MDVNKDLHNTDKKQTKKVNGTELVTEVKLSHKLENQSKTNMD